MTEISRRYVLCAAAAGSPGYARGAALQATSAQHAGQGWLAATAAARGRRSRAAP